MPPLTKLFSWQEDAEHNTKDDCWVVLDGKVYDVSDNQTIWMNTQVEMMYSSKQLATLVSWGPVWESSTDWCAVQVKVGSKNPFLICKFVRNSLIESISLDLEFDKGEDEIVFELLSTGCKVHLTGYHEGSNNGGDEDDNTPRKLVRRNSELFMTTLSRTQSTDEKLSEDAENSNDDLENKPVTEMATNTFLNTLAHAALCDKKPEEVTMLVESMLRKVMEEFEHRLASHNSMVLKADVAALDALQRSKSKTLKEMEKQSVDFLKEELKLHEAVSTEHISHRKRPTWISMGEGGWRLSIIGD